jgi:hypothetical protein
MTEKSKKSRDTKIFEALKQLEKAIQSQEADIKVQMPLEGFLSDAQRDEFYEALKEFAKVYSSITGSKPNVQVVT